MATTRRRKPTDRSRLYRHKLVEPTSTTAPPSSPICPPKDTFSCSDDDTVDADLLQTDMQTEPTPVPRMVFGEDTGNIDTYSGPTCTTTPTPGVDSDASHVRDVLTAKLPLITTPVSECTPSADNYITNTLEKKVCFRQLLDRKQLVPAPPGTLAYLKFFTLPKKNGVRPLVDGAEAASRGLAQPRYAFPMSASRALLKLARSSWFIATDLSHGYGNVKLPAPDKRLTVRINGRVYFYTCPPQGLRSSPAVCIEVFDKIFNLAGLTCTYSDNAAQGFDSEEEAWIGYKRMISILQKFFTLNLDETVEPTQYMELLGVAVRPGNLSLPPSKHDKVLRLIQDKDTEKDVVSGYLAYLGDVFGKSLNALSRDVLNVTVYCDGVKGGLAAAGVLCDTCDGLIDYRITTCKQDSQVTAELKGILLADRLCTKWSVENIKTDAMYAVEAQRKAGFSMCSVVARNVRPLIHVKSEENKADALSRGRNLDNCTCGVIEIPEEYNPKTLRVECV